MLWAIAMLLTAPLMRGAAMWRTWLALAGASAAAWLFPYPEAYLIIDVLAAALVIRRPKGWAQKQITRLFVVMICFEIGFVVSPQMNPFAVYYAGLILGWIQWALLCGWGLNVTLGRNSVDRGRVGHALAHRRDA